MNTTCGFPEPPFDPADHSGEPALSFGDSSGRGLRFTSDQLRAAVERAAAQLAAERAADNELDRKEHEAEYQRKLNPTAFDLFITERMYL